WSNFTAAGPQSVYEYVYRFAEYVYGTHAERPELARGLFELCPHRRFHHCIHRHRSSPRPISYVA
ncbi:hypothetical protein L6Q96_14985, partial [Candidatus Binatia bacterium]|nr:hypothetical protein [Candidatus Binatia bacterium]